MRDSASVDADGVVGGYTDVAESSGERGATSTTTTTTTTAPEIVHLWVKQGKTEHTATLVDPVILSKLHETREALSSKAASSLSCSDLAAASQRPRVAVRWDSTHTTERIDPAAIRFRDLSTEGRGSRRRRRPPEAPPPAAHDDGGDAIDAIEDPSFYDTDAMFLWNSKKPRSERIREVLRDRRDLPSNSLVRDVSYAPLPAAAVEFPEAPSKDKPPSTKHGRNDHGIQTIPPPTTTPSSSGSSTSSSATSAVQRSFPPPDRSRQDRTSSFASKNQGPREDCNNDDDDCGFGKDPNNTRDDARNATRVATNSAPPPPPQQPRPPRPNYEAAAPEPPQHEAAPTYRRRRPPPGSKRPRTVFHLDDVTSAEPPPPPPCSPPPPPPRKDPEEALVLPLGSTIRRPFEVGDGKKEQWFVGTVTRYDRDHKLYWIEYEDGDSEEATPEELRDIVKLTRLFDEEQQQNEKRVNEKASKNNNSSSSSNSNSNSNTPSLGIPERGSNPKKKQRRKKPKANDRGNRTEARVYEPFTLKILARRTAPRSEWKTRLQTMQTSEIQDGSRWEQEEPYDSGDASRTESTRYLIKWSDLSFLHCSWETEADLRMLVKGFPTALRQFDHKVDFRDAHFHDEDENERKLYGPEERNDGEYFDPAHLEIDRILAVSMTTANDVSTDSTTLMERTKGQRGKEGAGNRQFLVKWGNRPYAECSYEYEKDLIRSGVSYQSQFDAYTKRRSRPSVRSQQRLLHQGETAFRKWYQRVCGEKSTSRIPGAIDKFQKKLQAKEHSPSGGRLRDYQAEGVSWMVSNYVNGRSVILADEMGLGKTIQVAAFLDVLASNLHRRGPFLVVVPLSTITHWKRECEGWVGNLNTVVYHGSARDRELIRELEMVYESDRPEKKKKKGSNQAYLKACSSAPGFVAALGNPWMADIVLTTPEIVTAEDAAELAMIRWECLIVDEAQKIKTFHSKIAATLRDKFHSRHRILVTGTPIQNRMEELFSLLHFVDSVSFPNIDAFLAKYGDIKEHETLAELHEELQPYILRRLLEDVEKSVPAKEETIIEVELTVAQKQYYRALFEKNVKFLHKNKRKASGGPRLQNLAMQLRKCCNHLYLLNGIKEEFQRQELAKGTASSEGDLLVRGSGKLVLLDKLLPRLKEKGHRILVFSQFKTVLDILEDYLYIRRWKFERIDGSITGTKRQQAIDRFQAPGGDDHGKPFLMLLSTRAGGFGINLTAADTCIIFDSDWNPQNDLQAQARCHRIGQTKEVKVYRLLTRSTYEQQMFKIAAKKLGLDQAVLAGFEGGKDRGLSKEEAELLLRKGAYDILLEDEKGAEAASSAFQEQDIDTILKQNAHVVVHEGTGTASTAKGGKFSKAKFLVATGDNSTENKIDIADPDFWEKMLGVPITDDDPNPEEVLGKRARTVKSYYEGRGDREINDDEVFEVGEESEGEEDDELVLMDGNSNVKQKVRKRAKARRNQHYPQNQHDQYQLYQRLQQQQRRQRINQQQQHRQQQHSRYYPQSQYHHQGVDESAFRQPNYINNAIDQHHQQQNRYGHQNQQLQPQVHRQHHHQQYNQQVIQNCRPMEVVVEPMHMPHQPNQYVQQFLLQGLQQQSYLQNRPHAIEPPQHRPQHPQNRQYHHPLPPQGIRQPQYLPERQPPHQQHAQAVPQRRHAKQQRQQITSADASNLLHILNGL